MPYKDKEKQREAQLKYWHSQSLTEKRDSASAKRKRDIQAWYQEYKTTLKCSHCPENHPACLDFHHVNPGEKELTVSTMAGHGRSIQKILEEIAKCIVLCANCHRKLHAEQEIPNKWKESEVV